MSNKSVQLSIPKGVTVRGYTIKRLPLGKYLEAVDMMSELPQEMMRACFPGKTEMQALAEMKVLASDGIPALLIRMAASAPKQILPLISLATGIDEKTLLEDENIGLDGLAEMVEAFMKVNRIENFINAAKAIKEQLTAAIRTDGFNG